MSGIGFWGPYYSSSKTTVSPLQKALQDDDTMPTEIEQSSGFHVFEIHAPTAGVSFLAIVCALIAIGLAYGCYKKCCSVYLRGTGATPPWYSLQPPAFPMSPVPHYMPPPPPPQPPQPALEQVQLMLAVQQAMQPRVPQIRRERSPPRFTPADEEPSAPPTQESRYQPTVEPRYSAKI